MRLVCLTNDKSTKAKVGTLAQDQESTQSRLLKWLGLIVPYAGATYFTPNLWIV
jgi:hypothetical protein